MVWGPPGIPLEMLDLCRGSGTWGSPNPGKKEGERGSCREGNASSSAVTRSKVLQETLPQVCLL